MTTRSNNPGGRPPLAHGMKREIRLSTFVNRWEHARIEAWANHLKITIPEYLRLVAAGRPAPE